MNFKITKNIITTYCRVPNYNFEWLTLAKELSNVMEYSSKWFEKWKIKYTETYGLPDIKKTSAYRDKVNMVLSVNDDSISFIVTILENKYFSYDAAVEEYVFTFTENNFDLFPSELLQHLENMVYSKALDQIKDEDEQAYRKRINDRKDKLLKELDDIPAVVYVRTNENLDEHSKRYISTGVIYKAIYNTNTLINPYCIETDKKDIIYIRLTKCEWINGKNWDIMSEDDFEKQELGE